MDRNFSPDNRKFFCVHRLRDRWSCEILVHSVHSSFPHSKSRSGLSLTPNFETDWVENAGLPRQRTSFVVSHCGRHCDQTKCKRILGFGALSSYLSSRFCFFKFRICQDVDGNELQIRSRATRSEKSKKSSEKAGRKDKGLWKAAMLRLKTPIDVHSILCLLG